VDKETWTQILSEHMEVCDNRRAAGAYTMHRHFHPMAVERTEGGRRELSPEQVRSLSFTTLATPWSPPPPPPPPPQFKSGLTRCRLAAVQTNGIVQNGQAQRAAAAAAAGVGAGALKLSDSEKLDMVLNRFDALER
jgi:hypothetical protein